jgi:4-oxalocrotonate tautomerase
MPIVKIDMTSGRTAEMKRELINAVTAAVKDSLQLEAREVRVLLNEVDPAHWAIGGETLAELDARAKAAERP